MINNVEQYIFELIERITRFYIHLDEIKEQFYLDTDNKVLDKLSFLESYEQCLEKALVTTANQYIILQEVRYAPEKILEIFKLNVSLFKELQILHQEWLSHLPRPSEPIELRRFSRIIEKQVVLLSQNENIKPNISIYVSEKIGDETYAFDPIIEFKTGSFNKYLNNSNSILTSLSEKSIRVDLFEHKNTTSDYNSASSIHITIPRIDANNPCHWPILMHEVAHHMMGVLFPSSGNDIYSDFCQYIEVLNIDYLELVLRDNINLKSWLIETWCDLFACLSMGYSFWFAQFSAFLNSTDFTYSSNYPPVTFRLLLIQQILKHRFSRSVMDQWEETANDYDEILNLYNKLNNFEFWEDRGMTRLLQCFELYFLKHFFKESNGSLEFQNNLNDRLLKVLKYTKDISLDTILTLVRNLEHELPIPSIKVANSDAYSEYPTSVQEILCAAGIYRNTSFKKGVLESLIKIQKIEDTKKIRQTYKDQIERKFRRFDQSILRSIQVSEWFDFYNLNDSYTLESIRPTQSIVSGSILSDHEIVEYILKSELNVIPIFSLNSQLGSTSLDIRLGTSFQLFSPNEYGIIDFAKPDTVEKLKNSSKKKNLDFLESIVLMPGQFILGHSMEYIKLANSLSADLEGRSSFARLGIEIHMTAGFVDPGFEGVLTFEILNAGSSPVRLYPGLRIGQLRFALVREPSKNYSMKHTAKYRGLLEHHYSLQGNDYEVEKISNVIK